MKRRSRTRRGTQDLVINVAEARREINLALHLHRSSSSSSTPPPPADGCDFNNQLFCGSQYCYSLLNSMPQPEPVWSTTAPSVLAATPSVPYSKEALEFEWGESQQAASYSWWLGFLETLDHQANVNGDDQEYSKFLLGNSNAFVNINGTSKIGDDDGVAFEDANSDQSSSLDEWLLFPTTEGESEPLNLTP
ncbi:hypothetical protein FNV43_RR08725 [Rhamnella rubrinervis]|uniref:Uncharacterized protein n=1 Tax=Rhamnella rubrinervis TaxID=2594499 RepID=A0A8K0H8V1_9ROSA|nr:hypothetical protein FNV43_RR08725 [Rhamnella rubrinervis]